MPLLLELVRCHVAQATVWPFRVVPYTPGFKFDLGLDKRQERIGIEALVPQLTVEALAVTVLPGLSRLNVYRVGPVGFEPLPEGLRHELGSIVAAHELRRAIFGKQTGKHGNDAPGRHRAGYMDRQRTTIELVRHGEYAQLPAFDGRVLHKVIGPDVVRVQSFARYRSAAAAAAFGLLGNAQIVLAPQTVDPFVVDPPALAANLSMSSAVAEPNSLAGRGDFQPFDQRVVVTWPGDVLKA